MMLFMDFEASSLLPGSFPLEVALVDQDGQGETYLIKPHEDWLDRAAGNPGWSLTSEALHGISLKRPISEGVPADRVARRAANVLGRANVMACSDNPGFDGGWLETLFDVGGFRQAPRLVDVRQIYDCACRPLRSLFPLGPTVSTEQAEQRVQKLALKVIARVEEAEALRQRLQHRALPDAQSLWQTWRRVKAEVGRLIDERTSP